METARVQHAALRLIKEVFETESVDELAEKLATGKWIAVSALEIEEKKYRFCLGRVV